MFVLVFFFFFQAEDGIRDLYVTGVQTCALPISRARGPALHRADRAAWSGRSPESPGSGDRPAADATPRDHPSPASSRRAGREQAGVAGPHSGALRAPSSRPAPESRRGAGLRSDRKSVVSGKSVDLGGRRIIKKKKKKKKTTPLPNPKTHAPKTHTPQPTKQP